MDTWITEFLEQGGYPAIALLMFLENVFPPIPSELVMPLAGYAAQRGELSLVGVTLAGSLGSLAGAVFWYVLAIWFGLPRLKRLAARHGRWLTLHPDDIDRADAWFDRHGGRAVLLGRLVPAVRTLISVPAGVTGMPWWRFLAFTTIGTVAFTALLAWAGYSLGEEHEVVGQWIGPVSNTVLLVMLGVYLWRLLRWRP
ncbi:DedA family protein [Maricaulis sp. CAU 1757]